MVEQYDEHSLFCIDCTEDDGLKKKISKHGKNGACSICKQAGKCSVRFDELAGWLKDIWAEWFGHGELRPVLYQSSDKVEYEEAGDPPDYLISQIVQCHNDEEGVAESLMALMSSDDHYDVMQGGDPFIESDQNYQERELSPGEIYHWDQFVMDLKHHTRYFNKMAIEFFDNLFAGITEVAAPEPFDPTVLPFDFESGRPVIRQCEPGSLAIFRARKADDQASLHKILNSPESELGNPPDHLTTEGRMNPKGISYFYGAEERKTCVAELRPSISEKIISAEFELTESVRLLDLTLLSVGRHKRTVSMFDDDYLEQRVHRKLLRRLQRLIAQPVLSGNEFDYLPSQAMAEYLARHMSPRVDGIIFESVQHEKGRNVVLFPHVLRGDNHSSVDFLLGSSAIRIKPDTMILHEVAKVSHELNDQKVTGKEILVADSEL